MTTPTRIRVCIEERRGGLVNISLPYVFVRGGVWLGRHLRRRGFDVPDFQHLSDAEVESALREGITLTDERDTIRIFCE